MKKINAERVDTGNMSPFFSRRQYESDKRMMEGGNDPYNPELRLYGDKDGDKKLEVEVGSVRRNADEDLREGSRVSEEVYMGFLNEVRNSDVVIDRWAEYPETKSRLLLKYFPRRFGDGGEQDLEARGYNNAQIGLIFKGVVNYAKRVESINGRK